MGFISYEAAELGLDKDGKNKKPKGEDDVDLKAIQRGGSQSGGQPHDNAAANAQDDAAYRPSTDIRPQQDIGGSASNDSDNVSSSEKNKARKTKSGVKSKASGKSSSAESKKSKSTTPRIYGDTVQLSRFPRELMEFVKTEFPMASRREDALAAYIYIKSGKSVSVSDEVKELASGYTGDKTIQNMEQRMSALEKDVRIIMQIMFELQIGMSFLIADRKGLTTKNPPDARSVDLLESSVLDVRDRLKEMTVQQVRQDAIKNGRPIR